VSKTDRRLRVLTALPAVVWFFFIMILLSLPGTSFPSIKVWQPDKIAHILLFGMQQFLLWLALELPGRTVVSSTARSMLLSLLATVLFGVLSEVYQDVATSRMLDPYDMIANAAGALLSVGSLAVIGPSRVLAFSRRILRLAGEEKRNN
jgi:hypothetical protein